ncbi:MAG: DUF1810 domain-containing protein [Proteobacteria bacterium]|nr:DUF1810 domain-containing protein [Pseudomonadota bacterium]
MTSPAASPAFRDLQRFVDAQAPAYAHVVAELRAGNKETHWMWFVFPQLAGLGASPLARTYAIRDLAEARAYLAHPLLGPRLRECVALVALHADRSTVAMLGPVDAMKLRSSLTLFAEAAGDASEFAHALATFYGGEPDPKTLALLRAARPGAADEP